jgi:hypothetical protein
MMKEEEKDERYNIYTTLYSLKQRMKTNVYKVSTQDLPLIVEWILELEVELENLKRKKE